MEDLNALLKAEVNSHLEYLLKKIGNNRQQLSTKVIAFYRDINKELNKEKIAPERREAILREVSSMEKMAANQLPHYEPYSGQEAGVRSEKTDDRRQETEYRRQTEVSGQAVAVKEKAPVKKEPEVKAKPKPAPSKPAAAKPAAAAKAKPVAKVKPTPKASKKAKPAKKKK